MTEKRLPYGRDFILMVLGQVISLFGNSIVRFALSLAVLDLTGSVSRFATITAVAIIPTVLLSPVGGVLADRVQRQKIMYMLDFATAAVLAGFALVYRQHPHVLWIAALMCVLSVIQAFYSPSVRSSIPLLVDDEHLTGANGIVSLVEALSYMLGPVAGGFLYGVFGLSAILPVSVACFALSAVMECFLRIPFVQRPAGESPLKTFAADFSEAMRFLARENRPLLHLALVVALLQLTFSPAFNVGLPYIIKIFLGLSDQLYGLMDGVMGLGMILSGVAAGAVSRRIAPKNRYLLLTALGVLTVLGGLAVVSNRRPMTSYLIILTGGVILLFLSGVYNILNATMLQQKTPQALLGKVMSVLLSLSMSASPLGQALFGLLYAAAGDRPFLVLWLAGAACIVLSLTARKTLQRLYAAPVEVDDI